jgi:hypothetical protein
MAAAFTSDEEGQLCSIRRWVENECADQQALLVFYTSSSKAAKYVPPKKPYPKPEKSLALIERQLASIVVDQANVAASYDAAVPAPAPLPGNPSRADILYTIVLWHLYLSGALKAILNAEAGKSMPSPKPPKKPFPSAAETLATIACRLDQSSKDLKTLLARQGLAPGPAPVAPPQPFPSIDASLAQIEIWWASITQNVLGVAMQAPRRGLGGKPSFAH